MTLHLIDGCDDGSSWGATTAGTTGIGRTGKGISAWGPYLIPSAAQADTLTIGAAFKVTAYGAINLFLASGAGSVSNSLNLNTNGKLLVYRFNTIQGQTADAFMPLNTWVYLEWQVRNHDTLGFHKVRVNGVDVPELTLTNIDTKNSTGLLYDSCSVSTLGASSGIDDIYLMTGSGDTFLGDVVVETLYPTGNGVTNAWVGVDGDSSDNFAHVDETPHNITDWVTTTTVGAQDFYTFGDLVGTGTVLGVTHHVIAQKTDTAQTKSIKLLNRGSAVTAGPAQVLTTTFAPYSYTLATNPEGGNWTSAAVNALQAGVEAA